MGWCGEALQESFGPFILSDVGFDGVSEGGNVGEVGDVIILLVGDREGNRLVMSCHRSDDSVHIFSDQVYMVISLGFVFFVAEYHFADGNGAIDLRARRECGFEDLDSDAFDFVRRGGRETREVFLNLVRHGAGCLLANTPFESRKGVVVGGVMICWLSPLPLTPFIFPKYPPSFSLLFPLLNHPLRPVHYPGTASTSFYD